VWAGIGHIASFDGGLRASSATLWRTAPRARFHRKLHKQLVDGGRRLAAPEIHARVSGSVPAGVAEHDLRARALQAQQPLDAVVDQAAERAADEALGDEAQREALRGLPGLDEGEAAAIDATTASGSAVSATTRSNQRLLSGMSTFPASSWTLSADSAVDVSTLATQQQQQQHVGVATVARRRLSSNCVTSRFTTPSPTAAASSPGAPLPRLRTAGTSGGGRCSPSAPRGRAGRGPRCG